MKDMLIRNLKKGLWASIFIAFVTFAISYASLKYRGTHKLDRTFQSLVNVTDKQKYFERECLKLPKLQYSEDDKRIPSCPFISGDTYRSFCHHVFDDSTPPSVYYYKAGRIKKNELVFVATHILDKVSPALLQNAKEPYILITSNSDDSAPNNFQNLLKSENLIAWFPQNADMVHEKVYPLPIGLANYMWDHGNFHLINELSAKRKRFADRKTLLYINFGYSESSRKNIEAKFRGMKNVKFLQSRVDFKEYLEHMMDSKFVLSPRGHGIDCHRSWESMIMGAVPIVLSTAIDEAFRNTKRAIILDSWDELSVELLESYDPGEDIIPDVLYAKFWYDEINSKRIP